MASLETLFVTEIYRAEAYPPEDPRLGELEAACLAIAQDDRAGQRWSVKNRYPGYTSYASLNDLPWRVPAFKALAKVLDGHAKAFAKLVDMDLRGKPLALDSLWINVLPEGGMHGSHIHPQSIISGTIYVAVPKGAAALKFEDPRLAMMMAAPPRRAAAPRTRHAFVEIAPTPGTVLLWESYLRHEVPMNQAPSERISISFNYRWG